MRLHKITGALVGLMLSAFGPGAGAEEAPDHGGVLSFTFENDIFGGTDEDYTNGVRISYLTPRNDLPVWARFARSNLGWLTTASNWYAAYGLGHNIYTPSDITLETPPPDDRPYAGFLYGSLGVVADDGDQLDTIALDLGIVGPGAQADDVQRIVHDLIGADDPQGWDSQIPNEPGLRLLFERKHRFIYEPESVLFDLEFAAIPHLSVSLGNVDTSGGAGMTLLVGDRLDDGYGPPRIRPAVAGPGFFEPEEGFGWYVFAGAEARAVGRNIFVEGSTFRDSPGVDPARLVGDFQAGVALQFRNVELTYTHVLRTNEIEGEGGISQFGSVNLRTRF